MSLIQYYKLVFDVTQYHSFSLSDIENMIPFERDIFVEMLAEKTKAEENH